MRWAIPEIGYVIAVRGIKGKFCADLSFRHWRVENEKSDFYKWNHGRRENSNKQRIAKTFIKLCFLDGDWCWDMSPFIVNDETKNMGN